jgi:hypothetical protein
MKFGSACTLTGKPRGETPAPPPEKTNPGITAPAGVPRTVPPNRQVHLPRHACSLPHRTPPASCVWRAYPPPTHKICHEAMYWAELAARRAPARLRDPDWPASLQRACFRLLGFFRIWFGYLERRVTAHRDQPYWLPRASDFDHLHERGRYPQRQTAPGACMESRGAGEPMAMALAARAFRSEIDACLNPVSAGAWLTQAWLTAARHSFRRRAFVNLFPASGRISRFKNPFKYICKSRINQNKVLIAPS